MNEILENTNKEHQPNSTTFACIDCPFAIWQANKWRSISYCQKVFKTTFDSSEQSNFLFEHCSAKNNYLKEIENNYKEI